MIKLTVDILQTSLSVPVSKAEPQPLLQPQAEPQGSVGTPPCGGLFQDERGFHQEGPDSLKLTRHHGVEMHREKLGIKNLLKSRHVSLDISVLSVK